MANFAEPTEEQRAGWAEWVAERPEAVRLVAEKFNPWALYRLKTSNHRVTLVSFDEPKDGSPVTLRVNVTGEFNRVAFERCVFGIKPEDLEECDLPGPDEPLGSQGLLPEQVKALYNLQVKEEPST